MKSKFIKSSIFFAGVMFFLAIFGMSPIVVRANEELYFDNDGNLYYITREKKATGSVKYYTIGWIIKRYDMPINVAGQQYVIVTKSNYKPDQVDPEDSRYVYCYYKSDKDEILNAVKTVSNEWYNSLAKYGDTVYIDSVMTVIEKGVQQGYLYSGGKYTGEVYFDYKGIANARGWASPESLAVNFDMSVEFPALYKPISTSICVLDEIETSISNSVFLSAENGSDKFRIDLGIPSGEKMYVQSSVSKGIYTVKLKKIVGEMKIEVKIPVKYILKWTDYYGVKQEETRVVNRYYTIKRDFSYYIYDGYSVKNFVGIELNSNLFKDNCSIDYTQPSNEAITEGSVIYNGVSLHMLGYELGDAGIIDPVVLTSSTYLKPTIPDADYSAWAEKLVEPLMVRSDKVVIDGKVILSNEIKRGTACEPVKSFSVDNIELKKEDIIIDKEVKNGVDYVINGQYIFEDPSGNRVTYSIRGLTPVIVHTPVVCNESITSDKELNQAVNPQTNDVVLGSYITVTFNNYGAHRTIKGYGIRSYTSYIKKRQMRCGFDVVYKDVLYKAGTWIDTKDYYLKLFICENNKEGIYLIESRTIANNAPDICGDDLFEESANLSINKYGATVGEQVRLVGRIEKFAVEYNEKKYYAAEMPVIVLGGEKGLENIDYVLSIETIGDIGNSDYVEVYYDYFILDDAGNYGPVWVYQVNNKDVALDDSLCKLPEQEIWGRDMVKVVDNNGIWKKNMSLPRDFWVVEVGTTIDDIKQAVIDDKIKDILINTTKIYIGAEFVRVKDGKAHISYINESNAKKGYCNMWVKEGGAKKSPYGIFMELDITDSTVNEYEVSGTH